MAKVTTHRVARGAGPGKDARMPTPLLDDLLDSLSGDGCPGAADMKAGLLRARQLVALRRSLNPPPSRRRGGNRTAAAWSAP